LNETSGRQADHKVDEWRISTSGYVEAAVLPEQFKELPANELY